jgi:hypothetical protein
LGVGRHDFGLGWRDLLPVAAAVHDEGLMVTYCNRCNEKKTSNGPCPKCGCPEFRIEKK